jgi:hypothetical protein
MTRIPQQLAFPREYKFSSILFMQHLKLPYLEVGHARD